MEDRLLTKMAALLEEARAEGAAASREMVRHELIEMLSQPVKKNGHAPRTRTRAARSAEPPLPLPEPPAVHAAPPPHASVSEAKPQAPEPVAGDILTVVSGALTRMPQAHEGVDPDGLTQFIKTHGSNGDIDVSVRDVRGALRQMTMTGEVRRIARGRYVAATPPAMFGGYKILG